MVDEEWWRSKGSGSMMGWRGNGENHCTSHAILWLGGGQGEHLADKYLPLILSTNTRVYQDVHLLSS